MPTLSQLSTKELKSLARRIEAEIASRTNAAVLRRKFEAMASAQGFKLDDVISGASGGPAARPRSTLAGKKLPPKYVHPSNRKLAWSGRGTKPAWVKIWVEHGGSLDALETAAQKLTGAFPLSLVPPPSKAGSSGT